MARIFVRHPSLRVREIGFLTPGRLAAVKSEIMTAAALFPQFSDATDVEVVGSFARGNASCWSDIDVNIALPTWTDHVAVFARLRADEVLCRRIRVAQLLAEVAIGSRLQIVARVPDNRVYNQLYSLGLNRFFNKAQGDRATTGLKWDPAAKRWLEVVSNPYHFRIARDPFALVVPSWRAIYGAEFLEL